MTVFQRLYFLFRLPITRDTQVFRSRKQEKVSYVAYVWCRVCYKRWSTSVSSRCSSVTSASRQSESQPQSSSPSPPSPLPTLSRSSLPTPNSSRWVRDCLPVTSSDWPALSHCVESCCLSTRNKTHYFEAANTVAHACKTLYQSVVRVMEGNLVDL